MASANLTRLFQYWRFVPQHHWRAPHRLPQLVLWSAGPMRLGRGSRPAEPALPVSQRVRSTLLHNKQASPRDLRWSGKPPRLPRRTANPAQIPGLRSILCSLRGGSACSACSWFYSHSNFLPGLKHCRQLGPRRNVRLTFWPRSCTGQLKRAAHKAFSHGHLENNPRSEPAR